MKSEEKLNEALRAALKRKFDDFEEKPNPASFNIIRAHIKQPRNYKYLFLSLLLIGIAVTGVLLNQNVGEKSELKIIAAKVEDKLLKSDERPKDLTKTVPVNDRKPAVQNHTRRKADSNFPRQILISETKQSTRIRQPNAESNSARKILADGFKDNFFEQADGQVSREVLKSDENVDEVSDAGSSGILESASQPISNPTLSIPLSELESELIKSAAMKLPGVAIPEKSDLPYYIPTNSSKISWLVNAAALKSYQILTVPKSSGQDFQNFKFPSVFSLESVGYKFSVGLEKKGFQALLHYSTYRQKYSYEIAGNEYIVQNEGQNYTIVRPGISVTENMKTDLLGIGLNKQILWGRSPFKKYYASAGLEYSHALKSGPAIGWVNASLGKQFAVNRRVLLNVGPYAEFSPKKISGANNPFLYQPYRVGISLGMKLIHPDLMLN